MKRNVLQHKINTKLKPGLVASYDIWPGNGVGQAILVLVLYKFVTYLLTKTLTYNPGPTQSDYYNC